MDKKDLKRWGHCCTPLFRTIAESRAWLKRQTYDDLEIDFCDSNCA
jgi:hypothetical protein